MKIRADSLPDNSQCIQHLLLLKNCTRRCDKKKRKKGRKVTNKYLLKIEAHSNQSLLNASGNEFKEMQNAYLRENHQETISEGVLFNIVEKALNDYIHKITTLPEEQYLSRQFFNGIFTSSYNQDLDGFVTAKIFNKIGELFSQFVLDNSNISISNVMTRLKNQLVKYLKAPAIKSYTFQFLFNGQLIKHLPGNKIRFTPYNDKKPIIPKNIKHPEEKDINPRKEKLSQKEIKIAKCWFYMKQGIMSPISLSKLLKISIRSASVYKKELKDKYQEEFAKLEKLSKLVEKPNFVLQINNKSIRDQMKSDFSFTSLDRVSPPTFAIKKGHLILLQPLKREVIPTQSSGAHYPSEKRVMGCDVGIKHWATLSIMELVEAGDYKEVERFFLNNKSIFRSKFDRNEKKFARIDFKKKKNGKEKLPNIPRSLKHKMDTISSLQKSMEQYLVDGRKYRANKAAVQISRIHENVQRLHDEIANQVASTMIQIAQCFNVGIIKFENLKWSKHSKKRDSGWYLTKNQMHFLHAQIQQKVSELASECGIEIQYVNAKWTSQLCAQCYKHNPIEITRTHKKTDPQIAPILGTRKTMLTHDKNRIHPKGHKVQSDLNAARVISLAPPISA